MVRACGPETTNRSAKIVEFSDCVAWIWIVIAPQQNQSGQKTRYVAKIISNWCSWIPSFFISFDFLCHSSVRLGPHFSWQLSQWPLEIFLICFPEEGCCQFNKNNIGHRQVSVAWIVAHLLLFCFSSTMTFWVVIPYPTNILILLYVFARSWNGSTVKYESSNRVKSKFSVSHDLSRILHQILFHYWHQLRFRKQLVAINGPTTLNMKTFASCLQTSNYWS